MMCTDRATPTSKAPLSLRAIGSGGWAISSQVRWRSTLTSCFFEIAHRGAGFEGSGSLKTRSVTLFRGGSSRTDNANLIRLTKEGRQEGSRQPWTSARFVMTQLSLSDSGISKDSRAFLFVSSSSEKNMLVAVRLKGIRLTKAQMEPTDGQHGPADGRLTDERPGRISVIAGEA